MEQRLSIITLGVTDLAKSLAFYSDVLGWETESKLEEKIIFFKLNGFVLALFSNEELAKDATVPFEGSGFKGFTLAYNVSSKEEVDSLLKSLEAKGGRVVKQAQEVSWGGYSGYFSDLDGNLWEVAYNPYWVIGADGVPQPK